MILTGDALAVLRTLKTGSVQTCVTSPPYWGLRDYGTAKWQGGRRGCAHTISRRNHGHHERQATSAGTSRDSLAGFNQCRRCGARRIDDQIGLEATPAEYVAKLVDVFREVRRVLKDDGTLWLNLGDSYATGAGKVGDHPGGGKQGANWQGATTSPNRLPLPGLKPKDLIGIPWRVAFALQADGWYLRSDIIWSKPNPMPESVRDRPTKAHEYLFLLSKSRRYYYDSDAIKEACIDNGRGRNRRTVWTVTPRPYKGAHFATFPEKLIEPCILAGAPAGGVVLDPFGGAGTTAIAAERLDRRALLIELNPEYVKLTNERKAA